MATRSNLRLPVLLSLIVLALAPAGAEAAFVTAVDVSVRPAEGSPWSKGTLFRGQGFQVGATTSNGWAYGRAKGEAERCGWVLISEINSTTRTDDTCGTPKSEPLGDSEHVPGGGPSERWYVTCESATLHGNYRGPGQLISPAGSVRRGVALGWRYTSGDGYAASVDGPTGTPRFILRSCISRRRPAGPPSPPAPFTPPPDEASPAEALIGPPPFPFLDEEIRYERQGGRGQARASAAAAGGPVRVERTRATIRLAPGNIVIANGLNGDRFRSSGRHCGGWYFGTLTRSGTGAKHTGWVQGAGLTGRPRATRRTCGRSLVPFRRMIGFVNAPFRSVTFRRKAEKWTVTGAASQAYLSEAKGPIADGECRLHMNYTNGVGPSDAIVPGSDGGIEDDLFKSKDVRTTAKGIIGYRYTTKDGAFALVSVKSGHGKVGLWAFVKRDCVVPLSARAPATPPERPRANRVYLTEIRICNGLKPSLAVKRLNRRKKATRIRGVRPCELPNKATRPGRPKPDSDRDGWEIGSLTRPER